MKNAAGAAAALSFIAIPLGFASLSSLWAEKRSDHDEKSERKDVDDAIASIGSSHQVNYLYKTLEAAAMILKLGKRHVYSNMSKENADAFYSYLDELERKCVNRVNDDESDVKVIVIEGLPKSGVSTLANNLVKLTQAVRGSSVLSDLAMFEEVMSKMPPALAYAFQCVCNYAKAIESESVAASSGGRCVVVERMYHSSCALTVCAESSPEIDIASLPKSAYRWPVDLPQPSLVLTIIFTLTM